MMTITPFAVAAAPLVFEPNDEVQQRGRQEKLQAS
jgi:hypothetical protein